MAPSDILVLTVDVECDSDGGPTWRYASPVGFRGVSQGLGEVLQPVLRDTGALATLLVSNVVLDHAPSVGLLGSIQSVELGTHLHGDFLPPNARVSDPGGAKTSENQNEYSEEVERMKLERIGEMFVSAFGRRPTSFRAGRWSASGRTARLLADLGYLADSSVTPHVHWRDGGRSIDYRRAPEQPYRPAAEGITRSGALPIWELPVSIVRRPWLPGRPAWLRPSRSGLRTMRRVVASLRRRHPPPRTFVAMIHNTELTPGTSPYSRTPDAASRVAGRLRELLAWAASDGMRLVTMMQAAHLAHSERRPADHGRRAVGLSEGEGRP